MKYFTPLIIILLTFAACNDDGPFNCEKGSGSVVSEERPTESFHSIEIRGAMDVQITQDSFHAIVIEAQPNILQKITSWVSNERLVLDIDDCIRNHKDIRVFITMADVQNLYISGAGDFTATNTLVADYLDLRIDGSGDIDLNVQMDEVRSRIDGSGDIRLLGSTNSHDIEIDGSGDVRSFDMICDISTIDIDGSR